MISATVELFARHCEEERKRILYSQCLSCGATDAPTAHMCMDCYMRGIRPYQMKQITKDETNEQPGTEATA